MKVYNLSKNEAEQISQQLMMIAHYENVVNSLRVHLKGMIAGVVDKTDIPEENKEFVVLDLQSGTFSVQRPEEKETKNPVPKKE